MRRIHVDICVNHEANVCRHIFVFFKSTVIEILLRRGLVSLCWKCWNYCLAWDSIYLLQSLHIVMMISSSFATITNFYCWQNFKKNVNMTLYLWKYQCTPYFFSHIVWIPLEFTPHNVIGNLLPNAVPVFHNDVLKWKHFPRYWPFVRGIQRWFPHRSQWRGTLTFSLICALNKRLSKQSWGWGFETPLWRHCNAKTIHSTHIYTHTTHIQPGLVTARSTITRQMQTKDINHID